MIFSISSLSGSGNSLPPMCSILSCFLRREYFQEQYRSSNCWDVSLLSFSDSCTFSTSGSENITSKNSCSSQSRHWPREFEDRLSVWIDWIEHCLRNPCVNAGRWPPGPMLQSSSLSVDRWRLRNKFSKSCGMVGRLGIVCWWTHSSSIFMFTFFDISCTKQASCSKYCGTWRCCKERFG